jgi:hypothetical protein
MLRPVEQLPLRSLLLGGSCFCPTAKLHRYHCSLVQLFKNTKVRLILQVASGDGCFRRACFFNDLCESTKVVGELQGWGLLKRWFVVEKWVGGFDPTVGVDLLTWGYNRGLNWPLLGGSQVSNARPGAPFACSLGIGLGGRASVRDPSVIAF